MRSSETRGCDVGVGNDVASRVVVVVNYYHDYDDDDELYRLTEDAR